MPRETKPVTPQPPPAGSAKGAAPPSGDGTSTRQPDPEGPAWLDQHAAERPVVWMPGWGVYVEVE